jgi:hypothetical protein
MYAATYEGGARGEGAPAQVEVGVSAKKAEEALPRRTAH